MQKLHLELNIDSCEFDELEEVEKEIIKRAKEATYRCYAPYSHFSVGSAALLSNNEIISGNNQENAAYPSGLCAERTTLFYANSRYPDEAVRILAIAARNEKGEFVEEPISPCGACRQVMLEIEWRYKQPMCVLLYGAKKIYKIHRVTDLLPFSFKADSMK